MAVEKPETQNGHQLEGRYANYFQVGHNAFEFALDFGQLYVNGLDGHIHSRIITSPRYVKALLETLSASIDGYERDFGEIDSTHTSVSPAARSAEEE